MTRFVLLVAALLLASCGPDPSDASAANSADASPTAGAAAAEGTPFAAMSLLTTTWEIADDTTPMVISIDDAGAYIEEGRDGTHIDHGTYAHRNGKDCFTSAMGDKGTNCWTAVPQVDIGGSASATDDGGNRSSFKRVDYRALKLPG
jgi:hypothetical protein